jgi:hypothetical protein
VASTSSVLPFQLLVAVLGSWLHREQADVIAFLREENRILKARLDGRACVSTTASADAWPKWDSPSARPTRSAKRSAREKTLGLQLAAPRHSPRGRTAFCPTSILREASHARIAVVD